MKRAFALLLIAGLAGCGGDSGREQPAQDELPQAVAAPPQLSQAVESEFGTPVKDRVATLGLLNKRNNLTEDVVLKSGESRRIGNVIIKLATCERTLPWERPEEEGAFVQVFVEERASTQEKLAWHKVFSGWLFKNSPSLNVVEHPVYDVWVKKCAMNFPGEEAQPEASASASNAAKPSGSDSTLPPSPAPSESPSPSASSSPPASSE